MPFKTKLVPDYQIKWPFEDVLEELKLREENKLDIYIYQFFIKKNVVVKVG